MPPTRKHSQKVQHLQRTLKGSLRILAERMKSSLVTSKALIEISNIWASANDFIQDFV